MIQDIIGAIQRRNIAAPVLTPEELESLNNTNETFLIMVGVVFVVWCVWAVWLSNKEKDLPL